VRPVLDGAGEDVAHGGNASLMLLGHIDLVDRHAVRGWAADTDRPYGTLEVAVFVDGRLTGLARADHVRDDLKDPTTLGAGAHGLVYRFDPPLSGLQDHDVVVRFAEGGRLLGQWRVAREPEAAPSPEPAASAAAVAPARAAPATEAAPPPAPPSAPSSADAKADATPAAVAGSTPAAPRGISGALPGQELASFVDECSSTLLKGWAASETNPDEVHDISIFVDTLKVAQITCDLPRKDLARTGMYGDGARGFEHRFDPPLPTDREVRVTVVYSRTGTPLSAGDVRLKDGKVQRVTAPAALSGDEPRLLPPPSDPRALLEFLGLYDEAAGLAQLLSRLEFGNARPEQIHYSAFGTYPESVADVLRWGTYYPRDHLQQTLLSDAFQTGLIPLFLRAFPEKRRLIFVHIPKCAGTDLAFHFRARYPSLDRSLTDPRWTTKAAMFRRLARLAAHVRTSDSIFVHGHINLADHIAAGTIRPTDRVFTVIRDPFAVALSQINYVLTRFDEDIAAGQLQPDTSGWSGVMDLGATPDRMSDAFVKRVTSAALRNEDLILPNSLCLWLGAGGAQPVVDRLVTHDVELTGVTRYNEWLRSAWGFDATTRFNESKKFISTTDLTTDDLTYLNSITREDQRFYRTVERLAIASGKVSLTGEDLRGVVVR